MDSVCMYSSKQLKNPFVALNMRGNAQSRQSLEQVLLGCILFTIIVVEVLLRHYNNIEVQKLHWPPFILALTASPNHLVTLCSDFKP